MKTQERDMFSIRSRTSKKPHIPKEMPEPGMDDIDGKRGQNVEPGWNQPVVAECSLGRVEAAADCEDKRMDGNQREMTQGTFRTGSSLQMGRANTRTPRLRAKARLHSTSHFLMRVTLLCELLQANRNSFVLSSLIVSRSLAALSNSNRLAASRMSASSLAM
jgi:hypothetical protein